MKRAAVLSILVFAVPLAVGVKAEAQQQAKIPLVPPFESRNWLPTQADAAARSELSERPDGEQIARFRPMHRANHPKQNRDFHLTHVQLITRRFSDIAPVKEKGCLNFLS